MAEFRPFSLGDVVRDVQPLVQMQQQAATIEESRLARAQQVEEAKYKRERDAIKDERDVFGQWNSALNTMSSMLGRVADAADPDLAYDLMLPGMKAMFARLNPDQDVGAILPEKFDATALSTASTEIEKLAKAVLRARKKGDSETEKMLKDRIAVLNQGRETPAEAAAKAGAVKRAEMNATGQAGGFSGTSMDAQFWNVINSGNPASPEYAAAYYELFQRPRFVQTENGLRPVVTAPPPNVRQPGAAAPAAQPPVPGMPMAGAAPGGAPVAAAASPDAMPPAGTPTAGAVIPGTEKATTYTQGQEAAYQYGRRLESANRNFESLTTEGFAPTTAMYTREGLGGSTLLGEKEERFLQAEREFINAILRKQSGAAISPSEFESARKEYIPQLGDSKQVLEQKKQSRQRAMQLLMEESGRASEAPSSGVIQYRFGPDGNLVRE